MWRMWPIDALVAALYQAIMFANYVKTVVVKSLGF
jgi:hypothetical protein